MKFGSCNCKGVCKIIFYNFKDISEMPVAYKYLLHAVYAYKWLTFLQLV